MSRAAKASTILEFLTAYNPEIREPSGKKTNTKVKGGHFPAQVVEWDDFSIDTFKEIWNRELFDATLSLELGRGLKPYPDHDERFERVRKNEETVKDKIKSWSWRIVREALMLVGPLFEPSIWVDAQAFRGPEGLDAPSRENLGASTEAAANEATSTETPNRGVASSSSTNQTSPSADAAKKKAKKKDEGHWRIPDGSAQSYQSFLEELRRHQQGDFQTRPFKEMLPKEIKPTRKWSASEVLKSHKYFYENGESKREMQSNNEVAPIKQIFTYCVESNCRYGCIHTCSELVVLRIGLRLSSAVNSDAETLTHKDVQQGDPDLMSLDQLAQQMTSDGLMEYAVISWDNWCREPETELASWTVNLASFFVHLLAGGNCQVAHRYPRLLEEPRPKKRAASADSVIAPTGAKRARQSKDSPQQRGSSHTTVTGDRSSVSEGERPNKAIRREQGSQVHVPEITAGGSAERSSSTMIEEVGSTTNKDSEYTDSESAETEVGSGNGEKMMHSFDVRDDL